MASALATANRMFGGLSKHTVHLDVLPTVRVSHRYCQHMSPCGTATSCLCPPKRSDKCIRSQNVAKGDMATLKNHNLLTESGPWTLPPSLPSRLSYSPYTGGVHATSCPEIQPVLCLHLTFKFAFGKNNPSCACIYHPYLLSFHIHIVGIKK